MARSRSAVSTILLVFGALLFLFSAGFALHTRMEWKREERLHAPQGVLSLDLTRAGTAITAPVRIYRPGLHHIDLVTLNPFGRPDQPDSQTPFAGTLHLELLAPGGAVFFEKTRGPGIQEHFRPSNLQWTKLEDIDIRDPREGGWALRVRILEGDPHFEGTRSDIRLQPPQTRDMGWYAFGQGIAVIIYSLIALFGLVVTLAGWFLDFRKRKTGLP